MILREVVRYVLSLGMYLSAYPEAESSGVQAWMKNKHREGKKGVLFAHIGVDREDRELNLAMTAPRSISDTQREGQIVVGESDRDDEFPLSLRLLRNSSCRPA